MKTENENVDTNTRVALRVEIREEIKQIETEIEKLEVERSECKSDQKYHELSGKIFLNKKEIQQMRKELRKDLMAELKERSTQPTEKSATKPPKLTVVSRAAEGRDTLDRLTKQFGSKPQ